MLDFRSRSRGKSYYRTYANLINNRSDTSIFRTEIMSPFRNTMGFIYRIKRHIHLFKKINVFFLRQGFRSNI